MEFQAIIAMVVLTASLFLVFDKLFNPQQIQIVLETGQEVTTQGSNYFPLSEVLLLTVSSFLIGMTSMYLFYHTETKKIVQLLKPSAEKSAAQDKYLLVTPLLKSDEKKVFSEILKSNGEILQNKLVVQTGLNKVKITRMLTSLENKNLIIKERHGITNKIKLK